MGKEAMPPSLPNEPLVGMTEEELEVIEQSYGFASNINSTRGSYCYLVKPETALQSARVVIMNLVKVIRRLQKMNVH